MIINKYDDNDDIDYFNDNNYYDDCNEGDTRHDNASNVGNETEDEGDK